MWLADDDAVREVVWRSDGAAAGPGDDILIDASTVSLETSAQVARPVSGQFLAAQGVGLADDLIIDYFAHLPLAAPALRNRLDDIASGDHKGWFATRLGAKDLRPAERFARAWVPLPLAEAATRRYEQAAAEGWGDADIGAVVELVRRGRPSSAADGTISRAQQHVG